MPTLVLSSTLAMIFAKSENLEPTPFPSCVKKNKISLVRMGNDSCCTLFSKTVVTFLVALCAQLIQSAIQVREHLVGIAPTAVPGLLGEKRIKHMNQKRKKKLTESYTTLNPAPRTSANHPKNSQKILPVFL